MNFSLPPMPDPAAWHVLLVHFPIALLLAAVPVLLILALLFPRTGRQFAIAAGVILVLGAASAFFAVQTGERAQQYQYDNNYADAEGVPEAIEAHSKMGEMTRNIFGGIAIAFVLYLILSGLPKRQWPPAVNAIVLALFLAATLVAGLNLMNTAHSGGKLVHSCKLLAPLGGGTGGPAAAEDQGKSEKEEYIDER